MNGPSIPSYCQPTYPFLEYLSHLFSTCIPTPLSLLSSTFGLLSITSWLFAQLPQICKNHQNRSVEGLSSLFLFNWLLGDICNLTGAILLNQMFFQKVIGGYYVVVDVALMGQWIWYGVLLEKRKEETEYEYLESKIKPDFGDGVDVIDGMSPPGSRGEDGPVKAVGINKGKKSRYDTSFPGTPIPDSPAIGTPGSSRWNSGKNTLQTMFFFVTLFALALGHPGGGSEHVPHRKIFASPFATPGSLAQPSAMDDWLNRDFIGGFIAWISTVLYCFSRIPQLLKNHARRSCSGLSVTLFVAAFFGNFFYSLSLLSNPLAWGDYEPYGGGGLAGPKGSDAREWWSSALPFILGASGVLCQDGMIFLQFLMWGERQPAVTGEGELGDAEEEDAEPVKASSGTPWTRWMPSLSVEIKKVDDVDEHSGLMGYLEEADFSYEGFVEGTGRRTGYGTIH